MGDGDDVIDVVVLMLLCGDMVIVKGMVMVSVVLVMVKKVLMVMW